MEKNRSYSGFDVALRRGSRRKQTLSERLSIKIPGDRSDVEVRLTLRQAKALRNFLNENLD
jgi:hypothetical protein